MTDNVTPEGVDQQARAARIRDDIVAGRTALGIELGSTRIKACLVGPDSAPVAAGAHEWENQLVDRRWTYALEDVWALPTPGGPDELPRLVETAAEVLGVVADVAPDSDVLRAIRECKEKLGRFGHVLHLGALLGRTPSSTRISVFLPISEAVPYLERVGWSGDPSDVARTLRRVEPLLRDVQLDFDVDPIDGPRAAPPGSLAWVERSRWGGDRLSGYF